MAGRSCLVGDRVCSNRTNVSAEYAGEALAKEMPAVAIDGEKMIDAR